MVRALFGMGVMLFAAACGGGTATQAPSAPPSSAAPSAAGAAIACEGSPGLPVAVANFTYTPNSITTPVGGTVTWANGDSAPHSVTFDSGPDCLVMQTGGTKTATFNVAGSYPYHCSLHPNMKATVVVQ